MKIRNTVLTTLFLSMLSFLKAQELKITNDYIFTSNDSILTHLEYPILDTIYFEEEWKPLIINNKLNVTLINNQPTSLLFYIDTNNINALDSQNFPYENDLGLLSIILKNNDDIPVSFEQRFWHIESTVENYGKPKELYSFMRISKWNIYKNEYEDKKLNLYILGPNEKLGLSIDVGLPIDVNQFRTSSYDFSSEKLISLELIFSQSITMIEQILSKNELNQLKSRGIKIFDGTLNSNKVNIVNLKKSE